jgi:hypothetical protein
MRVLNSVIWAIGLAAAVCVNESAGAEYHVGLNGNDSAAGTEAAPWASIGASLPKLKAGDTLTVLPGVYRGDVRLTRATVASTKEAPVVLRSKEPLKAVLETGGNNAVAFDGECCYVKLDGFKITGGRDYGVFITGASHDIEVSNCEITKCAMGVKSARASDLTFRKLNTHHNGYGMHLGDKGQNKAHRMLIEDCTSDTDHKPGNTDGFCVEDGGSENLVFRRCVSSNNEDAGFDVKPEAAVLENCVAFGNKEGFKCWRGATLINCLAWGNKAWSVQTSGLNLGPEPKAVILIHCTLVGAMDLAGPVQVLNSIVVGNIRHTPKGDKKLPDGKLIEDYNLLSGGAEARKSGEHSTAGDPAANHDYHLKPASPAAQKGTPSFPEVRARASGGQTPVWDLVAVKTDLDGRKRTPDKAPDIGCFVQGKD